MTKSRRRGEASEFGKINHKMTLHLTGDGTDQSWSWHLFSGKRSAKDNVRPGYKTIPTQVFEMNPCARRMGSFSRVRVPSLSPDSIWQNDNSLNNFHTLWARWHRRTQWNPGLGTPGVRTSRKIRVVVEQLTLVDVVWFMPTWAVVNLSSTSRSPQAVSVGRALERPNINTLQKNSQRWQHCRWRMLRNICIQWLRHANSCCSGLACTLEFFEGLSSIPEAVLFVQASKERRVYGTIFTHPPHLHHARGRKKSVSKVVEHRIEFKYIMQRRFMLIFLFSVGSANDGRARHFNGLDELFSHNATGGNYFCVCWITNMYDFLRFMVIIELGKREVEHLVFF